MTVEINRLGRRAAGWRLTGRGAGRRLAAAFAVAALTVVAAGTQAPAAAATVIEVTPDGPLTIQQAIDQAAPGDTVLVHPGEYADLLDFSGKDITVRSSGGPQATTINAYGDGRVVTFANGESRAALLEGFLLTGGAALTSPSGEGGAILVDRSSPTIRGNVIAMNHACGGGGIAVAFGSPVIEDNDITSNRPGSWCTGGLGGGGILLRGAGQAVISGNVIAGNTSIDDGGGLALFASGAPRLLGNGIFDNTAARDGGGVSMVNESRATLTQNLIAFNTAGGRGGGLRWLVPSSGAGPTLLHNSVFENTAATGAALFADGWQSGVTLRGNVLTSTTGPAVQCGDVYSNGDPALTANIVWAASGPAWSGACADPDGTEGNLRVDPLLEGVASWYWLPAPGSPARDAGGSGIGLPTVDPSGAPRFVDGDGDGVATVDIGAFEAQDTPPPPPPPATAPSAPQDLRASFSKGLLTVTWQPPADDGGEPITSYVVRLVETGETRTVSGTTTSTRFDVRKNSVSTVEVVARNVVGTSPPATTTIGGGGGGGKCHPKRGC